MPRPDLVLRPGRDGARLVPDVAYPRAFTLRVGRTDQSYVDLDDPRRLEFDYLQQIAVVLDQVAPPGAPLRTVHIGGAAMSLPRYVAATRPRSAQVVLEPDSELTAFVRQHLPLPAAQRDPGPGRRRPLRGRRAAGRVRRRGHPRRLRGSADAGRADQPGVLDRRPPRPRRQRHGDRQRHRPRTARRTRAGCWPAWRNASRTWSWRRRRRPSRAAGSATWSWPPPRVPLPVTEIAAEAGRAPYPYRVLAGARLAQLLAGAAPFTDAEAEESPRATARDVPFRLAAA